VRAALPLLVFIALATPASANPYTDAVLADNPLAYWQLGDAGPTTVADLTGNGHTGTASAGVSFGQTSLLPGDTSDDSVTLSSTQRVIVPGFEKFGVGATGYSVEFWVVLNGPPSAYNNLVGDGEAPADYYLMAYVTSSRRIRAHAQGAGPIHLDGVGVLTVGTAHHVVTSWDQASGMASIYIDGELDNSGLIGSGAPIDTDNPIFLGFDNREPGVGITLDEVAIYDYALSPERVADHFALSLVPEPEGWLMLATGAAFLGVLHRRRAR
jgi:hypothetical protein